MDVIGGEDFYNSLRGEMTLELETTGAVELVGDERHRARPLFDTAPDAMRVFLFSVLEGNHVGRIYVDNAQKPTAVLAHLACDFTFLLGNANNTAFVADALQLLQSELAPPPAPYGQLLFLVPETETWQVQIAEKFSDRRIDETSRKAFRLDHARFQADHGSRAETVPAGFTLRRYNRALAESSGGLAEFWGGIDTFLAHGFGFALLHGDEVVSRCHAVLCGAGEAEISVETAKDYRRRGFAALTASAFIDHALKRSLAPSWSCWSYNTASIALADHLGFVPTAEMPVSIVFLDRLRDEQEAAQDAQA